MEIHLETPTPTWVPDLRDIQASAIPNPQPPKPGYFIAFDSLRSLAFGKTGQSLDELTWRNWRKVTG